MNVQAGLKELRDTLLCGYMWVATLVGSALWLWPSEMQSGSFLRPGLRATVLGVGVPGLVVAATLVAIVLGEAWSAFATKRLFRKSVTEIRTARIDFFEKDPSDAVPWFSPISARAASRLYALVDDLHLDPTSRRDACQKIVTEVMYSSPRLLQRNQELHGEYARALSGALFRDAISVPWAMAVTV